MKILLILLILCPLSLYAQVNSPSINQAINSVLKANKVPAIVAAIVKPTQIMYGYGGLIRADRTDTIKATSKFHLGSNTKAVTSFMVAKLVEQGKLKWSDKLVDIVPELATKIRVDYRQITLSDLLAHRARVRPYTSGLEYELLPIFTGNIAQRRIQFATHVLNQDTVSIDNSGFAYSNAGYAIATTMLERVSGMTWEELVRTTFSQLALPYFIGFPNKESIDQPWGHVLENNQLIAQPPTDPYHLQDYVAPAGDLAMSIVDYAKFIQLHLKGLLGESNYLKTDSYQLLHFGLKNYAYGWGNSVSKSTGKSVSYHDGSAGTYYAHTYISPSQQIAVIILANDASDQTQAAILKLRRQLLIL